MTTNTRFNYLSSKTMKLWKLITWATDVEIWNRKHYHEARNHMHCLVVDAGNNNNQNLQFRQACGQHLSIGLVGAVCSNSRQFSTMHNSCRLLGDCSHDGELLHVENGYNHGGSWPNLAKKKHATRKWVSIAYQSCSSGQHRGLTGG